MNTISDICQMACVCVCVFVHFIACIDVAHSSPQKSCMVIGIDVYHDKSYGNKSIAGFVASTNP